MALAKLSKRSPPLRIIAVIAAGILLALAAWYFMRPKPLLVVLSKVEQGIVEATISNTRAGTVKACRRAKLAAPSGGQISHLRVKKGERVKRGQVLLELWNEDLQAQERLTQDQLKTAIIQSRETCTQAETAKRDAQRAKQLRDQGFVSQESLERTLSNAKVRQASCESSQGLIEQSRSRIDVARASLQRMILRAPFNGIVADISGELGEYATPSPPGILTLPAIDLIDDRCLFVSAPIDEVDAAAIKVGQTVRITLDAVKGKSFTGKVRRIAPYVLEIEKQARTVEIEAAFTEAANAENLLVGYSADVEIVYASHDKVLRIPTPALLEGKRVLLYQANGILEDRTVVTGLANWEYTEITSGLNEGDQIVMTLDQAGVKAGARVQSEAVK